MGKVSEKSTKADIWEAYQALLNEVGGAPIMVTQDTSGLQKMSTSLSDAKTELLATFDTTLEKLAALPQAYLDAEQELSRRRSAALEVIEQDKKQLESTIAAVRLAWEQERVDTELARQREADEYSYTLNRKRRDEQDVYEQKTKLREEVLAAREAAVKEQEDTLKTLTAEVDAFPARLEAAVKMSEENIAESLKAEHAAALKDIKQAADHEKSIAALRLQTAEAALAAANKQVADFQHQLDAAQNQLKDMAVTVIQASKPQPAVQTQSS